MSVLYPKLPFRYWETRTDKESGVLNHPDAPRDLVVDAVFIANGATTFKV